MNNKENLWEAVIQEIFIDVIKKFFNNLRLYSLKQIFSSKIERILYILNAISVFCFIEIRTDFKYIKFGLFLSIFSYFWHRATIQEIREEYFRRRYSGFGNMFNSKAKVINKVKNKETGVIVYTIYSFIPRQKIVSNIDSIENYFNADVSISLHEHNKRILYIAASKTKLKKSDNKNKFKSMYYLKDYIHTKPTGEIPYLLGIGENGKTKLGDLAKEKHMLISGDTGGGKSTMVNSLLLSMMSMNDNISYYLVDFKWVELKIYEKLDNVKFIDEVEFSNFVEKLNTELDRRKKLICNAELQNIKQYNNSINNINKLPYIVLLIDEIADIKVNGTDKKETERIENVLLRLLNQGRALGIHCIFATQKPSGVQLSTQIRSGLVTKISFRIEEKRSQEMAGVKETELLQDGEFKIKRVGMGANIETMKGFYVDRIKEWSIFEKLKSRIGKY